MGPGNLIKLVALKMLNLIRFSIGLGLFWYTGKLTKHITLSSTCLFTLF